MEKLLNFFIKYTKILEIINDTLLFAYMIDGFSNFDVFVNIVIYFVIFENNYLY